MKHKNKQVENLHGYWWLENQQNSLSKIIFHLILRISIHLPASTKHDFLTFIETLALFISRLTNIFSIYRLPLYEYEGIEKKSNKKINILISADKESSDYFQNLVGKNMKLKNDFGNLSLFKILKIIKENKNYDMAILKTDIFYQKYLNHHKYLTLPEYVSFNFSQKSSVNNILTSFSQEIIDELNKDNRSETTYEISTKLNDFIMFYNKMYLPYVTWKHHSNAKIVTFSSILFLYHQGGKILFIKEKNEIIFAGLFLERKNTIKTYYAAFMQDKFEYLKKGVTARSYYYILKYALKNNKLSIDFGTARPFINDGLFKYKSKWGMKLQLSPPGISQIYSLKFKNNSVSVRNFLSSNPFIFLEKKNLIGIYFIDKKNKNSLHKKTHSNNLKGLSDIRFTSPRDFLYWHIVRKQ